MEGSGGERGEIEEKEKECGRGVRKKRGRGGNERRNGRVEEEKWEEMRGEKERIKERRREGRRVEKKRMEEGELEREDEGWEINKGQKEGDDGNISGIREKEPESDGGDNKG